MNTGNRQHVQANIDAIIADLRNGRSITAIQRQYRCGYRPLRQALAAAGIDGAAYRRLVPMGPGPGGNSGSFAKGQRPWNAGLKGIRLSPGTEFQPGHPPHNEKAIGTISLRRTKGRAERWIKVTENTWIPLARWIWQQHHGPIPDGCMVAHDDGNTLHDEPANLILVNRAEHLRRNRTRDGAEQKRLAALRKAAKKRWARYYRQKDAGGRDDRSAARRLRAARPDAVVIWMCSGCGHSYAGGDAPDRCGKCARGAFERNEIPRRLVI